MSAISFAPTQKPSQGYGLLAALPAVASVVDASTYFATDDNGGTLYQVQSGAWTRIGPRSSLLGEVVKADTDFFTTVTNTETDVTGLTKTLTVPGDRPIKSRAIFDLSNGTAGGWAACAIYRGATQVTFASIRSVAAGDMQRICMESPATQLAAGTYTWKVTITGGWLGTGGQAKISIAPPRVALLNIWEV